MTPGTPILDPLFSRNFGGLVLLCIEADFCDQGVILQHFSRSTRSTFLRTGRNSKLLQKFAWKFADFSKKSKKTVLIELREEFEPVQQGDQHPLKHPVEDDPFDTMGRDSWTLSESTAFWGIWSFFRQHRQIPEWQPPILGVKENQAFCRYRKE